MNKPFNDLQTAWKWLRRHPAFRNNPKSSASMSRFGECLDINIVKVNPLTEEIDDAKPKNTATRVWLECGKISKLEEEDGATLYVPSHDVDLDCGAPTFEEALLELADLVLQHYGDYRE